MRRFLWCSLPLLLLSNVIASPSGSSFRGLRGDEGTVNNSTGQMDNNYSGRRPVIGILSQTRTTDPSDGYYIAASYVKWLEAAGARAIPIPYTAEDDEVEAIFGQVNGILFPGGPDSTRLPGAARKAWALAKEANDLGDYFPMWGTCLGFEYMVMLEGSMGLNTLQRDHFDSYNISLPLIFTEDVWHSRPFAGGQVKEIASVRNATMNNHHDGIEPERFANDTGLSTMFTITATTPDRHGTHFVSAMEGSDYPFYGVQFHPEKNNFEYGTVPGTDTPYEAIDHSKDAIFLSLRLAEFFVSETRKNAHVYTDVVENPLVMTYEMELGVEFQQMYIIPSS